MKLIIGADMVTTKENIDAFIVGNREKLCGPNLLKLIDDTKYFVCNLEVPLCDNGEPIKKCGPNLCAPEAAINGYEALGVNLVTLANNHIMDQGDKGLKSTEQLLENAKINYVGAGDNLEKAMAPHIVELDNSRIGFYACAEHEFSIATSNQAGANPFDELESLDHISDLREKCDYLIVLFHGGKEQYQYPSPRIKKTCQKMASKGADLILVQHTHCIGCYETFEGSTIVYGQGNFLFGRRKIETWQSSLLICVDDEYHVSFVPLVISEDGSYVEIAEAEKNIEILEAFQQRSAKIQSEEFIYRNYEKYARDSIKNYLHAVSGKETWAIRLANKLMIGTVRARKYDNDNLYQIINYIDCESHRELFLAGIKELLSK